MGYRTDPVQNQFHGILGYAAAALKGYSAKAFCFSCYSPPFQQVSISACHGVFYLVLTSMVGS